MTEETNGRIFVYGTLRSGFQHPAYEYISRYFTLVGGARVKGKLYDMGSYPSAKPVTGDHFIVGELYQINHPDEFAWALAQLDDYEGVNPESDELPLFIRETTTVYIDEQTFTAWVYWFNGEVTDKPEISSGDVLQYIREKNKSTD